MEEVKNLQGNILIILSYVLFLLYLFFPCAHNPATTQYWKQAPWEHFL